MSGKVLMRLLEIIPIRRVMKGVSVNVLRRRFHMAFRKFAHFTEFSILSALLTTLAHRYFPQYEKSRRVRVFLRTVLPVSLALGYAFFDELHQRGSAGRDSNLLDVLIDFFGICFGLLLVKTITFLHQKRRRKKAQTAEADRANHD